MTLDIDREEINCDNVIECVYDLTELDKKILSVLSESEELTSSEVAEEVEKDQSTAYRSLEKMFQCGLVYKEKKTIRNGGYYFQYSLRPLDNIKEEALECIDRWYEDMREAIAGLGKEHL
ncbi:MAG: helix-turn-helix domain-containing protein [Candidatus Natronoplasma sp.]